VRAGAGPAGAEAASAEQVAVHAAGVGAVPSVRPAELRAQLRLRHRAGRRLLLRLPVRAGRLREAAAAVEANRFWHQQPPERA
jgi:hypothetical protein